jgi:hypothetical protein
VIQIIGYQTPITPDSERQLSAYEAQPGTAVEKPIEKLLQSDDTVKKTSVGNSAAYEIYEDDQKMPPPKSAVSIHQDTIYSASHSDILEKQLAPAADAKPLAELPAFQAVAAELKKSGPAQISIHQFGRTDRQVLPTYELFRTGKLRDANTKSTTGRLLKQFAADLDGSKLPEFDKVRHFFGPNGTLGVSEENGWFLKGVVLPPSK